MLTKNSKQSFFEDFRIIYFKKNFCFFETSRFYFFLKKYIGTFVSIKWQGSGTFFLKKKELVYVFIYLKPKKILLALT